MSDSMVMTTHDCPNCGAHSLLTNLDGAEIVWCPVEHRAFVLHMRWEILDPDWPVPDSEHKN